MPKLRPLPSRPRAPLARYANYFEVGHNPYEFLIDFGQYKPESASVVLHTRLALGPTHAKMFAAMLGGAISRHEGDCGPIADACDPSDPLEVVLKSLPDFERRALAARRRAAAHELPAPNGRRKTKR
jgi:hypothetical protein